MKGTCCTQDINWTYISCSEDLRDVFSKAYVRSIEVLSPGDKGLLFSRLIVHLPGTHELLSGESFTSKSVLHWHVWTMASPKHPVAPNPQICSKFTSGSSHWTITRKTFHKKLLPEKLWGEGIKFGKKF